MSPEMLQYHYDRLAEGYVEGLREATERGDVGDIDPEVVAWALMGAGELLGMRWVLWEGRTQPPERVLEELERIIAGALGRGA